MLVVVLIIIEIEVVIMMGGTILYSCPSRSQSLSHRCRHNPRNIAFTFVCFPAKSCRRGPSFEVISERVLHILEKVRDVSLDYIYLLILGTLSELNLAICNDVLTNGSRALSVCSV